MDLEEIEEGLAALIFDYQMIGENLDNGSLSLEDAEKSLKQKDRQYEVFVLELKNPKFEKASIPAVFEEATRQRKYVREKVDALQNPPVNY